MLDIRFLPLHVFDAYGGLRWEHIKEGALALMHILHRMLTTRIRKLEAASKLTAQTGEEVRWLQHPRVQCRPNPLGLGTSSSSCTHGSFGANPCKWGYIIGLALRVAAEPPLVLLGW